MTHTDTTQKTSVGAMKPAEQQWTGTPAEWDAELTARMNRLVEANFTAGSRSVRYVATATMPPRPVAPPSVVTASGWTVTWDGAQFKATKPSNPTNFGINPLWVAGWTSATEAEYAKIVALRDGPAPRYVEDGWRVRYATGAHYNVFPDKDVATAIAAGIGGTAHAIYKRVGGAGCVVCGADIAAVGSRYCESHRFTGGPCKSERAQ